jgi:hypothetical protein
VRPSEFDQSGGDVWTFQKHVSGRVNAAGCDEIYVEGPVGTTAAVIDGMRFSAKVPLRGGSNELRALCKLNDAEVARSNPQQWVTRNLLTGERIPAVTSMSLRLAPFQARVLSR